GMSDAPLLPYQDRWNRDRTPVKFCEKSRRVGLSYGDAAESAMLAAQLKSEGGMNTYYISYNKEMTETYIKDVGEWAKKYNLAASEFEEVVLEDEKDGADDYNFETIKKAVELCIEKSGPVHINIPLTEPLYNLLEELPVMPAVEKTIQKKNYELPSNLVADWHTSKRIMILAGTLSPNPELEAQLSQLVKNHTVVVLTEMNSNLQHDKFFAHIDRYITDFSDEDYHTYAPDLLITIGQNVVSKRVKQFLRKAKPKQHWHIDEYWQPDTYYALTQKIETKPEIFFSKLLKSINLEPRPYFNLWDVLKDKKDAKHEEYLNKAPFSDFYLFKQLSNQIPANYRVHFSNSSAIRYAQLFEYQKYDVYCNRGTSGIDGCTSTAMGFAMMEDEPTILITGDLSFFYDINGLWNQYIPPYT
ncbi:MAG: hypothetical protein DI598_20330, partial [Pseudopedobacter saltans]